MARSYPTMRYFLVHTNHPDYAGDCWGANTEDLQGVAFLAMEGHTYGCRIQEVPEPTDFHGYSTDGEDD